MNRYKGIRFFAYVLEILVLFMVQETPGLLPPILGARPVLLIPVALSIAFFETDLAAMAFGVLCGLFLDFGMGTAFGFHGLFLGVMCWLLGCLAAELIRTNLLTAVLAGILGIFLLLSIQWFFCYLLYGYDYPGYAYVHHYLPRMGYTLIFMPITYYFNRALALFLRERD